MPGKKKKRVMVKKVKKKSPAKKKTKKKTNGGSKNVRLALSGAMKDLETEIGNLSKKKTVLKRSLRTTVSSIDTDHNTEKKLQQQIAKLVEKEAHLNKKKKGLQTKIDTVSDKINKVTKIRSEMSDV